MPVPTARANVRHVPALDGLRAVALLGVLAFHAGGALPGGYLGVDLFFVLSGFLITTLLLAEHRDTGRIALAAFWVRRARRLLPALLALMPAIAVYGRFFASPGELQSLRTDALATLGYVANWHAIYAHKSYWELFTAPSPLEHTWSLSIEEQFYVVWPLIVALALRGGKVWAVRVIALVATLASAAAMLCLYDPANVSRAYLGTDTRAAGIVLGALLATVLLPVLTNEIALPSRTVRALDAAGALAALGLAVAWCALDGESSLLYHGGLWLTEALALVLIACAVSGPSSRVGRALGWRPLTLLGTISYGVYLWHWPVNVVLTNARTHLDGLSLEGARLATTLTMAMVSYRLIERPIRRVGVPFGRPVYVVPAAIALAVLLLVHATDASQRPAPMKPPPLLAATSVAVMESAPSSTLLLVGDSTANSLGWGLRGLRRDGLGVELRGVDGCTMLHDACDGPRWSEFVREVKPRATLVVLGGAFMHGLATEGRFAKACHPAWDRAFERALTKHLGELHAASASDATEDSGAESEVWVVTVPRPLGPWEAKAFRDQAACINVSLRKSVAATPGIRLLDLATRICPAGDCERERDGAPIRPDGVHFAVDGATDIATWVLDQIAIE